MLALEIDVAGIDEAVEAFEEFGDRVTQPAAPLLRRIGQDWINRVFRQQFQGGVDGDGKPWAPRSRAGQQIRPGGRPLFDRGDLVQSIQILKADEEALEVGTSLFYAPLLAFGGFTPRGSAIQGKRIPARPFLELGPVEVDRTYDAIEEYYFGPE